MMVDFGEPLLADVLEGGGGGDAEAYEEDISLRIGEGAQTVVIFLTGCIEKTEGVRLVANHYRNCIVIEDSRDIFGREFVGRVTDEKTGLAYSTITDDYTFYRGDNHVCNIFKSLATAISNLRSSSSFFAIKPATTPGCPFLLFALTVMCW